MSGELWLHLTAAGFAAVNALAALYVYRRVRGGDASTRGDVDDTEEYRDGDAVSCPDCGTENEYGYRFCRNCVAELPGGRPLVDGPSPPVGRGV